MLRRMLCRHHLERRAPSGNVGRAIGSTSWVGHISKINKLAAIGDVGELLIEGLTVGRGYLGPDETLAMAFVQAPSWLRGLQNCNDQRRYRTGDLVNCSEDGTIAFTGRKDDQVKVRVQRMKQGEVNFFPQEQ